MNAVDLENPIDSWTNYEGRTIANRYVLGRLLRSHGRTAFFATADPSGRLAVLRLSEAPSDEAGQLRRWLKVAEADEPNLIAIEQVGRTDFEGVNLTYALMEAEDAVLADVLAERPLTVQETHQVALSVATALATLHARNLVQEHVDANNVFAVGDNVKLRSDCVSECIPEGEFVSTGQAAATRARDVHDLGVLLLRCLTLEAFLKRGADLPEPFARIIPAAIYGTLNLQGILDLLAAPTPADAAGSDALPALSEAELDPRFEDPIDETPTVDPYPHPLPIQSLHSVDHALPLSAATTPDIPRRLAFASDAATAPQSPRNASAFSLDHASLPLRFDETIESEYFADDSPRPKYRQIAIGCAAAVLAMGALWHFALAAPARPEPVALPPAPYKASQHVSPGIPLGAEPATLAASTPTPLPVATAASTPRTPAPSSTPSQPAPVLRQPQPLRVSGKAPAPRSAAYRANAGAGGWRVVAFTFRRLEGARLRARQIQAWDPSLHPQIFVPNGEQVYLVTLGGSMSQRDAQRLAHIARSEGLAPDIFARNYR